MNETDYDELCACATTTNTKKLISKQQQQQQQQKQKQPNATISTNSAILCRICYSSENGKEQLLQPCNCSGTMGLLHRTCLERWLSQSNSTRCEICNFEFDIKKIPRSFSQVSAFRNK